MQAFVFTNERIEELEVLLQSHLKLLTEQHVSRC
jgi:conserved oligomeric Golgi complex subunit 6